MASARGGDAVEAIARFALGLNGPERGIREFAAREVRDGQNGGALAWLDVDGRLDRLRIGADGSVARLEAVLFDAARPPAAFAIGAGGETYAAVPDAGGTFSVVRLTAQGGKF